MAPKVTLTRTNTMDKTVEEGLEFIRNFDAQFKLRTKPTRYSPPTTLSPPRAVKKSKSPKRMKEMKAKKSKSTSPIKRTTSPRKSPSRYTYSASSSSSSSSSSFYSASSSSSSSSSYSTAISTKSLNDVQQAEIDKYKKERRMKSTGVDQRLTEIVFSFDTTGSMGAAIAEAKKNIIDITNRLFDTIAADQLRIGMIAHGDYCDPVQSIFQYCDLSNDKTKIIKWINNVKNGGGGDFAENYEQVIEYAAQHIKWTDGSHRVLVVIGDAIPHEPEECFKQMKTYKISNPRAIDWRTEIDRCWEKGIKVYAVQAHNHFTGSYFYQSIAARTCGTYVKLDNFPTVTDMLLMVCFREADRLAFDNFRDEVEREGRMDKERKEMFDIVSADSSHTIA